MGLLALLCIASTVAAEAVSLTCKGDGVGFRGVLRPSAERGTGAFCWHPSTSCVVLEAALWDSDLVCSAVPMPKSIITRGSGGFAPKCYKSGHSVKICREASGFIRMRLCNGWPGRWWAARCRRLEGEDIELNIIISCHGCPRKLALQFRWEASGMKGLGWIDGQEEDEQANGGSLYELDGMYEYSMAFNTLPYLTLL